MRVCFDTTKEYVLFIASNRDEYIALDKFPGFIKPMIHHASRAVLPVCFNLVTRLQARKQFASKIQIDSDVKAWLESPFKLAKLPENFKFHTPPLVFQEIALRYIYTLGSAGLLLDPGMGKSKVVLDYIWLAGFSKSVIVCPKPLLFVWEDEIAKHRPELSFYVVKTTDWAEEVEGVKNAQVTIINYTKAVEFKHRLIETGFKFIHLDEFLIKDPKSTRTKTITEIAKHIPFRAGGSGTLVNNSPADAFCPTRFLQPSLVGWNYLTFLDNYAVKQAIKDENGEKTNRNQIVAFKGIPEIKSILESCCIVMTKEEWLPLPEKKFIDLTCQMSQEQKEAYYGLLSNYYIKLQDEHIEVDNPLVMMSKLYQISNGFLYVYKETPKDVVNELLGSDKPLKRKKSDRKTLVFEEQPKIELLRQVLIEKIPERKVIIWFNMEAEFELISKLLNDLKLPFLSIRGGESKTGEKVRQFNSDPAIRYLVCQAKSVNYGITVLGRKSKDLEEEGVEVLPDVDTQVYTQIFYSFNFSLEVYLQQQDRIHRLGQEHVCEYYRLFCNSPIDLRIKQILLDKMTLREEMLVDVARALIEDETGATENQEPNTPLVTTPEPQLAGLD